jgi:anti-sigma B factor antagonist
MAAHTTPPGYGWLSRAHEGTRSPEPLSVTVEPAANAVTHVSLRGELDLLTARRVEEHIEGAAAKSDCVVLDLSGLTFLDSSGITALLRLLECSQRDGWRLALVPGPYAVQRPLAIAGVEDRLPFLRDGADGEGTEDQPGLILPNAWWQS